MRPATACYTCRLGKRRCRPSKTDPKSSCLRCERMKISCSLGKSKPTGSAIPPPHTQTQSQTQLQARPPVQSPGAQHHVSPMARPLSDGTISAPEDMSSNASYCSLNQPNRAAILELDPVWKQEMVSHYFDVVHDTHHSLFHRPTFERDLRNNQIPDVILYSVLSLGIRFASSPQRRDHHFAELAYRALDMRDLSIVTIQGCLLLGTMCFVDNKAATETLYVATAIRLGLILDLPQRKCQTELERQINLRVYWTLYMTDLWVSAGLKLSRQILFRDDVELPSEESVFLGLPPTEPVRTARGELTRSIWGEMAKLARIWSDVQDLNNMAVEGDLEPMALAAEIDAIAARLDGWQQQLPSYIQESEQNLDRANAMGINVGNSFAALHLGFHYYYEVLCYRFMAESFRHPTPQTRAYAEKCAHHAEAFCDLLYLCEDKDNRCSYAMVGHMLVVTSTVYMHRLLCSSSENGLAEEQAPEIRKRLAHNFEILTELQLHWVSLDACLSRLKVFHNACLFSIEHSFNMDRWMLRFILEHGSQMPEKFIFQPEDAQETWIGGAESAVGASARSLQDWYIQALS
ncbi:NADH dehydrogenase [Emericellopsis atlantica]|uniref:NADH dehydrogenase n=1 Tax=Emericellopsis atlantica TaxID=2614577 RepID=A0A9P8CT43_9HYPO|nr:NADH dehydrogenase [Emericellopsis atlantica]KAG9258012.1 NADH dehydrogenase [Emericellopsis atlantica]